MGEWGSISPECVAVQMMFAVNGKYKCARGSRVPHEVSRTLELPKPVFLPLGFVVAKFKVVV